MIIEEKGLDIDFKAITFTSFGGFGEGTHELIKEITNGTDWNCNDPRQASTPQSVAGECDSRGHSELDQGLDPTSLKS